MNAVGTMHIAVNANRNGRRRPPRSETAPRTGETTALSATLVSRAMLKTT